jgi:hypothetical protein
VAVGGKRFMLTQCPVSSFTRSIFIATPPPCSTQGNVWWFRCDDESGVSGRPFMLIGGGSSTLLMVCPVEVVMVPGL